MRRIYSSPRHGQQSQRVVALIAPRVRHDSQSQARSRRGMGNAQLYAGAIAILAEGVGGAAPKDQNLARKILREAGPNLRTGASPTKLCRHARGTFGRRQRAIARARDEGNSSCLALILGVSLLIALTNSLRVGADRTRATPAEIRACNGQSTA